MRDRQLMSHEAEYDGQVGMDLMGDEPAAQFDKPDAAESGHGGIQECVSLFRAAPPHDVVLQVGLAEPIDRIEVIGIVIDGVQERDLTLSSLVKCGMNEGRQFVHVHDGTLLPGGLQSTGMCESAIGKGGIRELPDKPVGARVDSTNPIHLGSSAVSVGWKHFPEAEPRKRYQKGRRIGFAELHLNEDSTWALKQLRGWPLALRRLDTARLTVRAMPRRRSTRGSRQPLIEW